MPGSMICTEPPCTCLSYCFPCSTWRNVSYSKLRHIALYKDLLRHPKNLSRREWQIVDTEAVVQRQPVYEDAPHQTLEVASILSFRAVGITPQFDTQ